MRVLTLSLLVLVAAGPALADPTADARAHYRSGQTHYSLGEFDAAIKEFREAYRLKQEPGLLFNIAQAYRQVHNWQQAYFNYQLYLGQRPDAPNRAEVESLIQQMRARLDEEEEQKTRVARNPAAAGNPESVIAAPAAATAETPARPSPPPSKLRIAGYVALGAGALGEGAAFLFHSSAQSAADQFNAKYAAGQLTAADASLRSDAQSKGKLATAALIGGAALLVTGAVLCFAF